MEAQSGRRGSAGRVMHALLNDLSAKTFVVASTGLVLLDLLTGAQALPCADWPWRSPTMPRLHQLGASFPG